MASGFPKFRPDQHLPGASMPSSEDASRHQRTAINSHGHTHLTCDQAESRKGILLLKGVPWESLVIQKTNQI